MDKSEFLSFDGRLLVQKPEKKIFYDVRTYDVRKSEERRAGEGRRGWRANEREREGCERIVNAVGQSLLLPLQEKVEH